MIFKNQVLQILKSVSLYFVLWEIFLQTSMFTLFTLRPSMFSGGKISSITFSNLSVLQIPQIRSWVTFCNVSLEIGGPFFSVLSYSWVRFSRDSVSVNESSACEIIVSVRSGLGRFSSWGEITPCDITVWLDWKDCTFCRAWGSSALLKTQWLERFETPAKHYQSWG